MTFFDKFKDRYNILVFSLLIIFIVIVFRLATLTVVKGEMYRELSDTKRVKQIPITAPRGEIRDRYGRVLATNKPSFTVQIIKDEIKGENFTKTALKLMKILEEEGEDYIDEFPIKLNVIDYSNEEAYFKYGMNPEDKMIDIIIKNELIEDFLKLYYLDKSSDNNEFKVLIGKKVITALENEGIRIPINIELKDNNVIYTYKEDVDILSWKKENNLSNKMNPVLDLAQLSKNNIKVVKRALRNPISRELTVKLLSQKGYGQTFQLVKYSFKFDEEYKALKRSLIKEFVNNAEYRHIRRYLIQEGKLNDISMYTSAKEDFANILLQLESAIEELINIVKIEEKEGKKIVIAPGKLLLDKLKENNKNIPIIAKINEDSKTIEYKYKDQKSKIEFLKNEKINNSLSAKDVLIEISKKEGIIYEVITDENIKYLSQKIILDNGINPKISVSNWEYVALKSKNTWLEKYNLPEDSSAKEAFIKLREKFKIPEKLSDYEARYILLIDDCLRKQGYRGYQPINFAYGVSNSTLARIEENNMELPGVRISVEPVRFYPMGKTAAHILGYLGKISQPFEIEKYIKELGYAPDDIIGKTGIEEKFEEYLRGEDGSKFVEVDVLGNTIKVLDKKESKPGNNVYLTIDAKLQKTAENALKHAIEEIQKAGSFKSKWGDYDYGYKDRRKRIPFKNATSGSVVAIDVKTGEVLAMANYPSYDPNLFATGISKEDWDSLQPENKDDPLAPRPLYNIAIRTAIQPGSTFKMLTALAALEKGIDPNKEINSLGYVELGNRKFGCWIWNDYHGMHGPTNLYEALRDSCNYYFYTVTLGENIRTGKDIGVKVNLDDILRLAEEFGLDDETGIEIDIPKEKSGGVPDPEAKKKIIKVGLRRFLNNNIDKYIENKDNITTEKRQEIIDEIVSWVDYEETLSRGEVMTRLSKLGLQSKNPLEGERANLTDRIKYDYLSQAQWSSGDTLNISIGQGQNAYTPLQMANYIATLVNGGYRYKVTVLDKIQSYNGKLIEDNKEELIKQVELNDLSHLEDIKKGMKLVSEEGTARRIFKNFPIGVGAKTGTAQTGINPATGEMYDNYAWFVAFAPYDDPEIAVSVVIFQGGHGSYAGPVAREVIAEYLGLNSKSEIIDFSNKLVR
ncbi:penicillin-binding protein 2 [Thermohalobacter berrensis]|uniref:Penicillin-binding protein 2 n=1 Tax=Thermohalobacter berrensis TaxID=99594 RepID=A0A419T720_9FIRM|nr:penicillin-binding protein 2 [Thermohalobacter berrensis]RKD33203.1 penicillin-binding protein 2 [Thermohalobacter berrensis]